MTDTPDPGEIETIVFTQSAIIYRLRAVTVPVTRDLDRREADTLLRGVLAQRLARGRPDAETAESWADLGGLFVSQGKLDSAGNWPLKVDVKNLPAPPKGQYYEMFLSRRADARAASCGTFRSAGDTKGLRLNAPYSLRGVTGWVVTLDRPGSGKHPVILTT